MRSNFRHNSRARAVKYPVGNLVLCCFIVAALHSAFKL
ncbi:hypothetical protein BURPS1710A_A0772 [Burkholderia pseudomallei 1710a]|uniref:Uncharacterized protein n=1 Tax=Burkholderia pseudomallei 1710a TaxID=320371 RepID=A0A0E1VQQ4_BURPE|nr:hypothetical protein BURPS1710A_A0772 [Burkholderia pseudomallei 1710a]